VLQGGDSRALRGRGPRTGTADPGQTGTVVLSGHRDTLFRPLRPIRAGDRVVLVTPRYPFHFLGPAPQCFIAQARRMAPLVTAAAHKTIRALEVNP